MTRTFTDEEAVREQVNLMLGLVGPSGSGKTVSALELAHGIQAITGGDIYMADTENKRGKHYAGAPMFSDKSKVYKFRHIDFKAPFGPLDYLAAFEHCTKRGAKIIITDSMSHEHEGPGGVLEMHEEQLNKLAGTDFQKRDKVNMLAWAKPKGERRRLINTILQMPCMFIFCFRAKEKIKMQAGKPPVEQGFMPIAGEEFVFEMTQNFLLYPGSKGTPIWSSAEAGERTIIKQFGEFAPIFAENKSLSAWHGRAMAEWAKGGKVEAKVQAPSQPAPTVLQAPAPAPYLAPAKPAAPAPQPIQDNLMEPGLIKELSNSIDAAVNAYDLNQVVIKMTRSKLTRQDMQMLNMCIDAKRKSLELVQEDE